MAATRPPHVAAWHALWCSLDVRADGAPAHDSGRATAGKGAPTAARPAAGKAGQQAAVSGLSRPAVRRPGEVRLG